VGISFSAALLAAVPLVVALLINYFVDSHTTNVAILAGLATSLVSYLYWVPLEPLGQLDLAQLDRIISHEPSSPPPAAPTSRRALAGLFSRPDVRLAAVTGGVASLVLPLLLYLSIQAAYLDSGASGDWSALLCFPPFAAIGAVAGALCGSRATSMARSVERRTDANRPGVLEYIVAGIVGALAGLGVSICPALTVLLAASSG
jgi:hypothetical protein